MSSGVKRTRVRRTSPHFRPVAGSLGYALGRHAATTIQLFKDLHQVRFMSLPMPWSHFLRAESGAGGQTAVTEKDVKRFRLPLVTENSSPAARNSNNSARK